MTQSDMETREQAALEQQFKVAGPMDPLLEGLAMFTSAVHLDNMIESIFTVIDVDGQGGVSCEELAEGLEN
ncbi:hypothetical protein T484DRAFT_1829121, partial [Baffinella frigidus]